MQSVYSRYMNRRYLQLWHLANCVRKTVLSVIGIIEAVEKFVCCGGLVVSVLDSGSRDPRSSPGRVIAGCVLGQGTLLSQCPSPLRSINGYQ